ncbi:hypothetical protein BOX15_Mlig013969g1, partial [Macrostomum lignano]
PGAEKNRYRVVFFFCGCGGLHILLLQPAGILRMKQVYPPVFMHCTVGVNLMTMYSGPTYCTPSINSSIIENCNNNAGIYSGSETNDSAFLNEIIEKTTSTPACSRLTGQRLLPIEPAAVQLADELIEAAWTDDSLAYHSHLLHRAAKQLFDDSSPGSAASQRLLTGANRRGAIAWLAAAARQLSLSRATLHLAASLFDRYLIAECLGRVAAKWVPAASPLPLAAACLSLAAKLHEQEAVSGRLSRLIRQLLPPAPSPSLLELECRLVGHFDGDLGYPTEAEFAQFYHSLIAAGDFGKELQQQVAGWLDVFLDRLLLRLDLLRLYPPSLLGLAALTAAMSAAAAAAAAASAAAAATPVSLLASSSVAAEAAGAASAASVSWCPRLARLSGASAADTAPLVAWLLVTWASDVQQYHHLLQQQQQQQQQQLASPPTCWHCPNLTSAVADTAAWQQQRLVEISQYSSCIS